MSGDRPVRKRKRLNAEFLPTSMATVISVKDHIWSDDDPAAGHPQVYFCAKCEYNRQLQPYLSHFCFHVDHSNNFPAIPFIEIVYLNAAANCII